MLCLIPHLPSPRVAAGWLLAAATALGAAEPAAVPPATAPSAASPSVATINGVSLTLREIEDAMLRREGADLVEEWVHRQLERLDFTTLRDGDVILSIGFNKITRREIADSLLRKGAGKVRDELINIRLVGQAIAAAGIVVGPAQVQATWERMKKRFEDGMAAKDGTRIDFANYLQVKEKQTPEQFMTQPGFRMLAGLQALVHQQAADEWDDRDLRAWFEAHKDRWRQVEAVDLAVIAIPYRPEPGPDGKPVVTSAERERLMQVCDQLRRQIVDGQLSFAQTFAAYGRTWDPETHDGGVVGPVDRQGRRDGAGDKTRPIGRDVVAAAWLVRRFPTLLPAIPSDWGVELAEVRGHRPAREPTYEDVRDQVKADRIDDTLEQRTEGLLRDLRAKARIAYESLPEVIGGRR